MVPTKIPVQLNNAKPQYVLISFETRLRLGDRRKLMTDLLGGLERTGKYVHPRWNFNMRLALQMLLEKTTNSIIFFCLFKKKSLFFVIMCKYYCSLKPCTSWNKIDFSFETTLISFWSFILIMLEASTSMLFRRNIYLVTPQGKDCE